ncbi:MAG: PAC2 family protein [Nitrososphaerota archaeon]|nr:PAC2 family protein [Candidatus Calditenuaceae archaeon]MDW8073183.1 PAC2 family protein [Nitrososphaerota archaeon]
MKFSVTKIPTRVSKLVAGLPDMGNVAGIALEHLIYATRLEQFAICIDNWPPFVTHTRGMIEFERGKYAMYFRDGLDFIAMTGTHQPSEPSSLYELCENVLDIAQQAGVEEVYTIGAAHYEEALTETPRVFHAYLSEVIGEKIRSMGSEPLESEGYITGFNGLLLGIARERGLTGACILGEISDPQIRQPAAAKAVLEVISRLIDVTLDFTKLDEEIERLKAARALERVYRRGRAPGVM